MAVADNDLLHIAHQWHGAGKRVAVAMVVRTWGSAPRAAGSHLIIDEDGRMEGSISGGCVEGAVLVEALEALEDGKPRLLDYGVSDDEAFAVGLACGGEIQILVDPVGGAMPLDVMDQILTDKAAGIPVAYVADLKTGARRAASADAYSDRFRLDRSGVEEDSQTFVAIHNPPLRLIVVGAVHIAQHLVPMAQAVGFDVTVIDPRSAFASPDRFPDVTLLDDWPDEAVSGLKPDTRTAVVTLTHDPKLDEPALMSALRSDAFYVGSLGSTRTHAKRVARLSDAGLAKAELDRIHTPIGLNIGGRAPAEIAVSVIAEIVQTLRSPT